MTQRIHKRFDTFEIITKGEQPVDIDEVTQDAFIAGFNKVVENTLDLRYKNDQGCERRHDFVGIDMEIK
jgi:hypothetical protein